MNDTRSNSGDIAFLSFLDQLKNDLRAVREDQNALRLSLRRTCEHFKVGDGCIAVAMPDGSRAELISVIPRDGNWDLECLAEFIHKRRPRIPPDVIMAPLFRRGRLWAALALRGRQPFEIPSSYLALRQVAKVVSESIELLDWQRNIEVRSQIDRKMLEQLRPKDLFYQILHGLRSLTDYDHSSALLIFNQRENTLELVAEQIAWVKRKSHRIGLKLQLDDDISALVRGNMVYGYNRRNGAWEEWSGRDSIELAKLLDYNEGIEASTSDRQENCMLCAPLATRDGVLGVLKVAACYPGSFNTYEADLVQRFTPLAAVAIQNSQRAFTLEAKMLEAEKKHAVANLLRGVSHDVNNALGCVLPLVQQILADIQSKVLEEDTLSQDLHQIEQSIQTCRRIFGGMLALARDASQGIAQANLRRALDTTLAVLRDGLERQRIQLDVQMSDVVPNIQTGQGDLEQLLLNLTTNARDAMAGGGILSIRTENVGDHIAILIQDSGCGIPSEVMSRIQEPFFTTKENGNGLGLSICRSIVWNAGGRMEMTSRPGAGTEVRVLLPVVRNGVAATAL
jgi:nitrogen-specific signal transduction histidine kinase